jgi:hypothetical protein
MTRPHCAALALVSIVALAATASAQTNFLYFESNVQSGTGEPDFIGQGWEQTWTDANANFFGDTNGFEHVVIDVQPKVGEDPDECWASCDWTLEFGGPDALLSPGTYDMSEGCPGEPAPCLRFFGDTRGCNDIVGTFTVLEVGYLFNQGDGAAVGITKFAADFSQKCLDTFFDDPLESVPSLDGIIRFNSGIAPDVGPVFLDGFENGDLASWSSTS